MKSPLASGTDKPASEPGRDRFIRNLKIDGGIQESAAFSQNAVEKACLDDRTRKPIKEERFLGRMLGDPLLHHRLDEFIRYQFGGLHVLARSKPEWCFFLQLLPEQVTSSHRGSSGEVLERRKMRAFPGTGGTEECDVHAR